MPADTENPESWYVAVLLPTTMLGAMVQVCRRCGVLLPQTMPGEVTVNEVHDQMHDTLDSIAAILEQHREVMDRD